MSRGNLLLELQTADDHVTTLQRQVSAMETSLAGDPDLDRLRAEQREAHDATVHALADVKAAELELGAIKAKADALHKKLYGGSVRNPSELVTLQHEHDAMVARLSPLEDTVLERIDDAETLAAADQQIAGGVAAFEQRREVAAGPDRERLTVLRESLAVATRERDEILLAVLPTDAALYEKLKRRLTPAVAHVANNSCGGCRMPLGIQEAKSARAGDGIVQCGNCDRILVS